MWTLFKPTEKNGIAMATTKYTTIIGVIAGASLVLQVLILFRNECHLTERRSIYTSSAITERSSRQYSTPVLNVITRTDLSHKVSTVSFPKHTKEKRYLTIGIPTVRRKNDTYVFDMLNSMLNKTSHEDLKKIVFVVFLADQNETKWKTFAENTITSKHRDHIKNGSLIVIQAPSEFYSQMTAEESNYLNWRRKQNYDYAYLMKYSAGLSKYYMQMEDDIIAGDNYFSAIKEFIDGQKDDNWICLEFSELGFIGKLYHSNHINKLADMLLMFSHSQPVDYTFIYFNILMSQGYRLIRKPTLFQHMGYYSSLPEKIQQLKDRYYDFKNKVVIGDNPEAKIRTTLKTVEDFPPELAYSKEPGHFWSAAAANQDDTFTVIFEEPQAVTSCVILTGSNDHPGDIVENGVLEASPLWNETEETCSNYVVIASFDSGSLNATDVKSKMGLFKIKCLQIRLTKSQIPWVIVREFAVFVEK